MGLTVLDAGVEIAGLDSDDAHHAAAAVEVGADHLLTTDQRWTALRRLGLRARLTVVRASPRTSTPLGYPARSGASATRPRASAPSEAARNDLCLPSEWRQTLTRIASCYA